MDVDDEPLEDLDDPATEVDSDGDDHVPVGGKRSAHSDHPDSR